MRFSCSYFFKFSQYLSSGRPRPKHAHTPGELSPAQAAARHHQLKRLGICSGKGWPYCHGSLWRLACVVGRVLHNSTVS